MNNFLSQKWCLCLNVQNRIKLCRTKNHKFVDETTVVAIIFSFACFKHTAIFIINYIIKFHSDPINEYVFCETSRENPITVFWS